MTDSHYSGTPSGPIPRTRVTPNGKPGDYEIHWGPVEKAVAGLIVSLLLAAVLGGVALYREVGEIRATQVTNGAEVKRIGDVLEDHLRFSRDIVPKLLTREEYQRDKERRH